jgi:hypothetical protein
MFMSVVIIGILIVILGVMVAQQLGVAAFKLMKVKGHCENRL